ncbi:MAG: hypothetical protein ACRDZX_07005, partial [Acidimicrobiales bacterium]
TYPEDISDRGELERRLLLMADAVAGRVRGQGMVARTVTLKLRYGDFTTLTRSRTFTRPQATGPSFWKAARALLATLELRDGVRLLGISASGLLPVGSSPGQQLRLDLAGAVPVGQGGGQPRTEVGPGRAWDRASEAVDAVRARFGQGAVIPAWGAPSGAQEGRREGKR